MSHSAALAAITKSTGKRPITQLETVRVADMKQSDIGKANSLLHIGRPAGITAFHNLPLHGLWDCLSDCLYKSLYTAYLFVLV